VNPTRSPITLTYPTIAADVLLVIEQYAPVLLNTAHQPTGMVRIRQIVRGCGPTTAVEARTLLATASRYLAGFAPTSFHDPDRWIRHNLVASWAHAQQREGMSTPTLANRLTRLRRMLRVLAGLPARMPRNTKHRVPGVPLSGQERLHLELALAYDDASAVAYVASVGANLTAKRCRLVDIARQRQHGVDGQRNVSRIKPHGSKISPTQQNGVQSILAAALRASLLR
jgi:hypothetical protein